MIQNTPYVITISRQIGSGGSYIGQRLASRLGITYVDREIVRQTAERLGTSEANLIAHDERITPFWKALLESSIYSNPEGYTIPPPDRITDKRLYQIESEIILDIAKHSSAVIIGRGGHYLLHKHPRHLSIFLHADITFRQQRIQETYHLSPADALKMIKDIDISRANYLHMITKKHWMDASQYHITLDTGILGLKLAEDIIVSAAQTRFGLQP